MSKLNTPLCTAGVVTVGNARGGNWLALHQHAEYVKNAVQRVGWAALGGLEQVPGAFAALRAERAGGPKLVGYWHSHPSCNPTPSLTDAEMAAPDGKLWLIDGFNAITAWRAVEHGGLHGRFDMMVVELV